MSNYIYNPNKSYTDYLRQKQFVSDINKTITMEISNQTRQLIASNRAMEEIGVQIVSGYQNQVDVTRQGFETISYQMKDLLSDIEDLQASFEWGFSDVLTSLGHINDSLNKLISIATTPVQTTAYNHFEIARDAFRRRLYAEALQEIEKAINGVTGVSPGYPLEWRFYQLIGIIRMGFIGCDVSLVDLDKAENAFITAAKYAEIDYANESARLYLCAARSAYLQGKYLQAIDYLKKSLQLNNKLGESMFLLAKIYSAIDKLDVSYDFLKKAIQLDNFYALKAASDGDFQKHNKDLDEFIRNLTNEYYYPIEYELKEIKSECSAILVEIDNLVSFVVENRTLLDYNESKKRLFDLKSTTKKHKSEYERLEAFINRTSSNHLISKYEDLISIYNSKLNLTQKPVDYYNIFSKIKEMHSGKTLSGITDAVEKGSELISRIKTQMGIIKTKLANYYDTNKDLKRKESNKTFMLTVAGICGFVVAGSFFLYLISYFFTELMGKCNAPNYDTYFANTQIYLKFSLNALWVSIVLIAIIWIFRSSIQQSIESNISHKCNKLKSELDNIDDFLNQLGSI